MLHNLTNILGSISSASNHLLGVGRFDSTVWITCSSVRISHQAVIARVVYAKVWILHYPIALPNCTIRSTLDLCKINLSQECEIRCNN